MTQKEKLLDLIDLKRKRLHDAIDEKGLDHPKTLKYSQELDKLIYLYTDRVSRNQVE